MTRLHRFCVSFALVALATSGTSAGPRAPVWSDTDGDGDPDYAFVGDWDGDGTLEMEDDIQAAIDTLTDSGPKLVELGPGDFIAPLVSQSLYGILDLPSLLTLQGAGAGTTVLHGFPGTDLTSLLAVIANVNPGAGNSEIVIRDLEIDGGWGSGDVNQVRLGQHRMGVFLSRCTDCTVERVTVRDTLHSCLYSRNGTNIVFQDNLLERCGNYTGSGPTYSCLYLFASSGLTQQNVHLTNNTCTGSGAAGISLRRQLVTDTLRDIHITGNTISAIRTEGSNMRSCMKLRGVEDLYVTGNNLCDDTGGVDTQAASGFYDTDVGAVRNVVVEDLRITNSGPGAVGLLLRGFVDGGTFRRIEIDGTSGTNPCMTLTHPLRDVLFEDVTLSNCGGRGLYEASPHGSGNSPDERLTARRLTIEHVGQDEAVYLAGAADGMTLEDLTIDDVPGIGLRFLQPISNSTISGLTVSRTGSHAVQIAGGSANNTIDGATLSAIGGDGILLGDAGSGPGADQLGLQIVGGDFQDVGGRGIGLEGTGVVLSDVRIEGNTMAGIGREAIALNASASSRSDLVRVTGNLISDFGRDLLSGQRHGVELSGRQLLPTVEDNVLADLLEQAEWGIDVDVDTPPTPVHLCTNQCSGTLTPTECVRVSGEPAYQLDVDTDGLVDSCDDCPGDATNDADGDGACEDQDTCPGEYDPIQADADGDGNGDLCDNCAAVHNTDQADLDLDTVGDACDNCALDPNVGQADLDVDGEGDLCDTDDGLIYSRLTDLTDLEWQPEAGYDGWNVYRGKLSDLKASGVYTRDPISGPGAERWCDLTVRLLPDPKYPPPGMTFYYLVTGTAGGVEGDLGTDGSGTSRPHDAPCP